MQYLLCRPYCSWRQFLFEFGKTNIYKLILQPVSGRKMRVAYCRVRQSACMECSQSVPSIAVPVCAWRTYSQSLHTARLLACFRGSSHCLLPTHGREVCMPGKFRRTQIRSVGEIMAGGHCR